MKPWPELSTEERRAAIISLNKQGLGRASIGKRLGCAETTINTFVVKHKVPYTPVSVYGGKSVSSPAWELDPDDDKFRKFIEKQDRKFQERFVEVHPETAFG